MSRIGFLADDLTGASDVLAQAHRHGLDAALVLDPASALPDAEVVGVAGTIRSLSGAELDTAVRDGVAALARADLGVLIHKVCSTFDSSPTVGSIGRAVELLREAWPDHGPVAVAPAQPDFGRYTAFSQHFGRHGDEVHRLDRHPVMSRHPSTPMTEADLRRVLAAQLSDGGEVGTVHLPALADARAFGAAWEEARRGTAAAFVVDAVAEADLDRVAAALLADRARPALVVGSGGIMAALARAGGQAEPVAPAGSRSSGPTLAISASASAVTGAQIDDALARGWTGVAVAVDDDEGAGWDERAAEALRAGRDVVAYTTRGPDDPAYRRGAAVDPAVVGHRLGAGAARLVGAGLTRDLVVCGGDTSSHALGALGVAELRVVEQFVPVAPICAADHGSVLAGCRLVLKGGQVGPSDLLRRFRDGPEEGSSP